MDVAVRQPKVTVIPASKSVLENDTIRSRRLRVAAYCRVSTDSEEQINSYNAQKAYYTQKIAENPGWEMAGVFADEGISGVSLKNRTEFKRMIAACKRGRIDMILTKSLSRFARNTVDCLETVRMLKLRSIGVIFEKENIDTMKESSEFLITLFSSFAQAESESLSKNVSWGIRKSMEAGNVPIQYSKLLGYRKGPDGKPEIVPEEARIVKQIYRWYIDGYSLSQIRQELAKQAIPSPGGASLWSTGTIKSLLSNEKYIGDALMQKTYTLDCISKKVKRNNGEYPMIYVENHHDPIISREVFRWVQEEMARRTSKRRVQQKNVKTEQGKYSGIYALSEKLVCAECGAAYRRCTWTASGTKRIVWRCISRLEYGKKYCHNSPTLEEEKLHAALLGAVNGYLSEAASQKTAMELAEITLSSKGDTGMSIAQMQNRIDAITEEQNRLLELLLENLDDPELSGRMKALTEEKQRLNDQIEEQKANQEQNAANALRLYDMREWADHHAAGFRAYDDQFTRKLIKRITVIDKTQIQIEFVDQEQVLVDL